MKFLIKKIKFQNCIIFLKSVTVQQLLMNTKKNTIQPYFTRTLVYYFYIDFIFASSSVPFIIFSFSFLILKKQILKL